MQDVSGGVERVRAWPRPRGKAKTKAERQRQRKFAAAQMASKYISPQQYCDWVNATDKTPLLPRDMMTSLMFNRLLSIQMNDGRTLYPMPARIDVSQSLDALGQTPGSQLIRGPDLWEANVPSQAGLAGASLGREAAFTSGAAFNAQLVPWTANPIDQGDFWDAGDPEVINLPFVGWYLANFFIRWESGGNDYRELRLRTEDGLFGRVTTRDGMLGPSAFLSVSGICYAPAPRTLQPQVVAGAANYDWQDATLNVIYL